MNIRNKDWRNSMRLTVDYNYMMKKFIGADGFKDSDLNELKEAAADAFDYVADNRGKGMMGWTELPYNQKEIVEDVIATAKEVRRKFKYFVVLGIGGSALGPIAVFNALCHLQTTSRLLRGRARSSTSRTTSTPSAWRRCWTSSSRKRPASTSSPSRARRAKR